MSEKTENYLQMMRSIWEKQDAIDNQTADTPTEDKKEVRAWLTEKQYALLITVLDTEAKKLRKQAQTALTSFRSESAVKNRIRSESYTAKANLLEVIMDAYSDENYDKF